MLLWSGAQSAEGWSMSFLNLLIRRIRKRYTDEVPIAILERTCR